MTLSVSQLARITENPDPKLYDLRGDLKALLPEMRKAGITTRLRVAAFLANVGVETDYLKTLEEYGDKAYWMYLDRHPDGGPGEWRYHGRGYLQVTWSSNYRTLGTAIDEDLIRNPDLLCDDKKVAAKGAIWYWSSRKLNSYADRGDFKNVCSIINYGSPGHTANHYNDRLRLYNNALKILPQGWTLDAAEEEPVADRIVLKKGLGKDGFAGSYEKAHPTNYEWREDIGKLAHQVANTPGWARKVWLNTYWWHPPYQRGVIDFRYDNRSFDVWGWSGRGARLDPTIGDEIFKWLFSAKSPGKIHWIIYKGRMWVDDGRGWRSSPPGPAGSDAGHWNHIHVTYH